MLDQGLRLRLGESKLYVAVHTLILPWPLPTYSSLENIFKCIAAGGWTHCRYAVKGGGSVWEYANDWSMT